LVAGTYLLNIAPAGDDANLTGDLDILSDITIAGIDLYTTYIDANSIDRAFHVHSGATVTLSGVSLVNGSSAFGAGILNENATLSLDRVTITQSTSTGNGGGIYNAGGTVKLNGSTIGDNTAQGSGGGIENASGITNIYNSTINNNIAAGDGGGIHNTATLTMSIVWTHDNQSNTSGAGIYNVGQATIMDSPIHDNYATLNGGNIYNSDAGGLGLLTISESSITHGFADANGGGIYNDGELNLTNLTISANRGLRGDGIYNVEATLSITLTNVTLTENLNNPVLPGEGIYNAGAAVVLKNTLIAHNGSSGDCAGALVSEGNNLEYGDTCSLNATGDITDTDPLLGPFQDNGGHTWSFGLLPGSPAINAGTNNGCPTTDQRGVLRPHGATCDIGAYETNTAPSAMADAYSTDEDVPLVVSQPGVLGNDSDPDGDAIAASLVASPAHGVLALNANGSFSYTPAANYHGPDSFSYRADDNAMISNPVLVTLNVSAVNDTPAAAADSFSTAEDTPLIVTAPGLLTNDSDPDNDVITATLVTMPSHGALALAPNGALSYIPNTNYHGPDSFSYRVDDGSLESASVPVALTITSVNDPPIAANDTASTRIDTELIIPAAVLLSNDTDIEDDLLSISAVRNNSARGGRVALVGSNVIYTPPAGFSGTDSLIYTVSDVNGGTASGTVTVSVAMRLLYIPLARR
jgi:hypothetical protein